MSADPRTADTDRQQIERAILDEVTKHRARWFPTVPGSAARLRALSVRPRAILYAVHLDDSSTAQALAKVRRGEPTTTAPRGTTDERPRLRTDVASETELTRFEYEGLETIASLFTSEDPRFSTVRPLAHLAEHDTILMDFTPQPTLHRLLNAQSRPHRLRHPLSTRSRLPDTVWANAGAWLRVFHDDAPITGLPGRQETRAAVQDRFEAYADYFTRPGRPDVAATIAREGSQLAGEVLPDLMPMALGHGDYAPRNLFASATGQVTVIDPMPRWAVPRAEDINRFLVALRLLGVQVHSHGAAFRQSWIAEREELILGGYFGEEPVPHSLIRCYELLILLDKWSALVSDGGPRGRLERTGVQLARGYITSQARYLLDLARR